MTTALATLSVPTPTIAPVDQHEKRASSLVVASSEQYLEGSEYLSSLKTLWDTIEAQRVELKAPTLDAGRKIDEFFKPFLKSVKAASDIVSKKLTTYDAEQRRLAAERQREAEAAAQRERERKAQEAEVARQKAAAEAAQARELAAKQEADRQKAIAEAAQAQAAGDRQRALEAEMAARRAERRAKTLEEQAVAVTVDAELAANKLEEEAKTVVAPEIKPELVKVEGQQRVTYWEWELVDLSKVDRKYLKLDEQAVTKIVNAMKGKAEEFIGGGIRVYSTSDLRRSKK